MSAVGYLNDEGFLTLKDCSNSGGRNVRPPEVEEVLPPRPSVPEVPAIGQHHADWLVRELGNDNITVNAILPVSP